MFTTLTIYLVIGMLFVCSLTYDREIADELKSASARGLARVVIVMGLLWPIFVVGGLFGSDDD